MINPPKLKVVMITKKVQGSPLWLIEEFLWQRIPHPVFPFIGRLK
jgi:hypothetical protein